MDDILNSLPHMNKGTAEDKNAPTFSPQPPQTAECSWLTPPHDIDITKDPQEGADSKAPSALPEVSPLTRIRQRQTMMGRTVTYIAHDLSDTMFIGNNTTNEMLEKQLSLLHSLFQITVHQISGTEHINDEAPTTYFDNKYLDLALRVQEQCTDTAKALSQMKYMEHLSGHPHPPFEGKQKELGKNDS